MSDTGIPPMARLRDDGSIEILWPDPKPKSFRISTTLFEILVEKSDAERALADDLRRQVDTLTNTYVEFVERTRAQAEEAHDVVDKWRGLADAQAAVLANYFDERDGRYILADDPPLPDVVAVMARHREARS